MKFKIKKSYYRLFSVLLSVVMIVLSVPISAFADGGDGTVPTIPPITEGDTVTPEPIDPPPDDDGGADAGTDGVVVPPIPDDPDPDPYPMYLDDGVYTIRNAGNTNMYMDTNSDSPFANSYMQQTRYTSPPVTSTSIGAFFKITRRSNNLYVIRLMTNNCLTFASSNGDVKTVEISPNDSSVAISQLFAITAYENGYRIKSNADNKLIVAPSGSASGDSNAAARLDSASSVTDGRDKWIFTKYTGSSFTNVTINECPTKMITGQTATVNAYVSSTFVGRNGHIEYSVTETNYLDTNKATIDETSGALTANSIGTVYVWATCSGTPYEDCRTVNICRDMQGVYFFKNCKATQKYMQIDDDVSLFQSDAHIELHSYDSSENAQKWLLTHIENGYYSITSVASGQALTAPASPMNSIVQTGYSGTDRQLWSFIYQSTGYYKISPKSNLSYYMSAGDDTLFADRNVEIRTSQSDGADKWIMYQLASLNAYKQSASSATNEYMSQTELILWKSDFGLASKVSKDFYTSLSVNEAISRLQNNSIFVIHTHGSQTSLQLGEDISLGMNNLNNQDLSNLDFAILLSCNTGIGNDPSHIINNAPVNIIEKMVTCGAETVLGFNAETICDDNNSFVKQLISSMVDQGMSLEEAIESVDCSGFINTGYKNLIEVAGNRAFKIRDGG